MPPRCTSAFWSLRYWGRYSRECRVAGALPWRAGPPRRERGPPVSRLVVWVTFGTQCPNSYPDCPTTGLTCRKPTSQLARAGPIFYARRKLRPAIAPRPAPDGRELPLDGRTRYGRSLQPRRPETQHGPFSRRYGVLAECRTQTAYGLRWRPFGLLDVESHRSCA